MRKNNCEVVRRELDELMLDEMSTAAALAHLRVCAECSEFHEKQTKLRQMVGSLGTVAAPADFDFRLRARLANESSLRSASWIFAPRGLAFAAALLLFIALGVVVVRNLSNRQSETQVADKTNQPSNPAPPQVNSSTAPPPRADATAGQNVFAVRENGPQKIKSERNGVKPKRPMMTVDSAGTGAEVLNLTRAGNSEVFPIDASQESFKVSLDDGRGNYRTISVPTIRFGSQRMLSNSNQLNAKGVW